MPHMLHMPRMLRVLSIWLTCLQPSTFLLHCCSTGANNTLKWSKYEMRTCRCPTRAVVSSMSIRSRSSTRHYITNGGHCARSTRNRPCAEAFMSASASMSSPADCRLRAYERSAVTVHAKAESHHVAPNAR